MSGWRIPFSEPTEETEWVYTTKARIACESCGEWIYARRRPTGSGLFAFPPECPVCGSAVPSREEEKT